MNNDIYMYKLYEYILYQIYIYLYKYNNIYI